jgi:hypothetical protein
MLSLRDALHCSTHLSIRWSHRKNLCPTRDFPQMHLQEPELCLVHKWRVSEETRLVILRLLREISTGKSMSKSGTRTDYLLRYLRSPRKSTFKCLCKQTPLWLVVMSKSPQEPWRSRWLQERDVEQSAPTHAHHTHCTSRQLGTIADWRNDVPWVWLWDACQMARVHWGTRCKRFCSKECPHYHIEWSARNQLEQDQVQRAPEKSSRSCCQTSNNQPWFTTWEIPWGFLAWAVLRSLSIGLCHARKCQFKEFCVRRKEMICELPMDVHMRNLQQKAERETGTNSCIKFPRVSCFEKTHHVCQKYGGACTTWYSENQRYKKRDEKLDSRAAEKGVKKLLSSDSATILEKESSVKD